MSIKWWTSVMPSNHLILCCPLVLLPSIFPSISIFSNESVLHIRWPKYCFSFSISPSIKYPGLISFRLYWLHLDGSYFCFCIFFHIIKKLFKISTHDVSLYEYIKLLYQNLYLTILLLSPLSLFWFQFWNTVFWHQKDGDRTLSTKVREPNLILEVEFNLPISSCTDELLCCKKNHTYGCESWTIKKAEH